MDDINDIVGYYGSADLSYIYALNNVETFLNRYKDGEPTINQYISAYNLYKIIVEDDIRLPSWGKNFTVKIVTAIKKCKEDAFKYFAHIDNDNVLETMLNVSPLLKDNAFELLCKTRGRSNCLSGKIVDSLVRKRALPLDTILKNDEFVKKHATTIRKLIIDSPNAVQIILHNVMSNNKEHYYLGGVIDNSDVNQIIDRYMNLDIDEMHPGYLQIIANMSSAPYMIDTKLRLKASDLIDKINKRILAGHGNGFLYKTSIQIGLASIPNGRLFDCQLNGTSMNLSYSKEWFEAYLDFSTILNNFLFCGVIVDYLTGAITLANNNDDSLFGSLTPKRQDDYNQGFVSSQVNSCACMFVEFYYSFLAKRGIYIEDVVSWFFGEYLNVELGVKGFNISVPNHSDTNRNKCTIMFSAIESVMHQWAALDKDSMEVIKSVADLQYAKPFDVQSLSGKKYVSLNQACATYVDIDRILHSSQSTAYIILSGAFFRENPECKKRSNLYDLLTVYPISCEWIGKNVQSVERYLVPLYENDLINNNNDIIKLSEKAKIIHTIHRDGSAQCSKFDDCAKGIVEGMLHNGELLPSELLFSDRERKWFYYYFSKETSDSLELRNKYVHGRNVNMTEEEHDKNYCMALVMMIAIIIKINDDIISYLDSDGQ